LYFAASSRPGRGGEPVWRRKTPYINDSQNVNAQLHPNRKNLSLKNKFMRTNMNPSSHLRALAVSAFLFTALPSGAQVVLTDLGTTAPAPGPNDIAQLSTAGNTSWPDGLNYFTDNQAEHDRGEPGQTFTTGSNPLGYVMTRLAISTGTTSGNMGSSEHYYLHIAQLNGDGTVTPLVTNVSQAFTYTAGDWLEWDGLAVNLTPNTTYVWSFGKQETGSLWDNLNVSSGNPYAGGQIALVPVAAGIGITYGSSHGFDAVFDIGLSLVVLRDLGTTAPTPGPNDIAQLSTAGNTSWPDGLNYFTDNQAQYGSGEPGQTFTTGSNPSGYVMTRLAISTGTMAGNMGSSEHYYLHIAQLNGDGTVTPLVTNVSQALNYSAGDWLEWDGLGVSLTPSTTYVWSFGKQATGSLWNSLNVSSGNPYAGGQIALVPIAAGIGITYGVSHGFDAVFDLGLVAKDAPNQVAAPVFNPPGGRLTNGQAVAISTATVGAFIRYTTDGSLPTSTSGTLYSSPPPFSLIKPMTLNAIAYKTNLADSPIASAHYNPPPSMAVGNNLDAAVDWSASWPFVDVFRRTHTWMTRNLDGSGGWDTGFGSLIPVDTNGWPTQVPFSINGTNQLVHTIMNLNEAGTYSFIYEGSGSLLFKWAPWSYASTANLTATGGVQSFSFTATATNTQAIVEIYTSATNDYLRNFHIVLTNSLATYTTQPFHALFLQRLQPFKCLRFMQWGMMYDTTLRSWTNRTTPSYYTQANPHGVALEYMVQLCNTLQADAWICIANAADDSYVQQAAQLLRDSLNPSLQLYVEYSNETWAYPQTTYVQAQGVSLGLDPDPYTAGQKYVARRSGQIWSIFQQVFGSAAGSRLVKVMATQTSWTAVTDIRVSGLLDTNINVSGVLPDAIAIAPYFGKFFAPSDLPPNAPYPTVNDILTNLSVQSIAEQQLQVGMQKAIADAHGWRLVGYEGGQTFVGSNGAENDANLTAILTAANRDPRMFTLYIQYLNMLKAQGVDQFNNYSYCGNWGQYGNWGSLEFQDQPTNAAPKYAALVQWIADNPVPKPLTTTPPVVQAVAQSGGSFTLTWSAAPGQMYQVQYKTDLNQTNWMPLGSNLTASNSTLTASDSMTNSRRFYRVMQLR
jgi:hypothetical protein